MAIRWWCLRNYIDFLQSFRRSNPVAQCCLHPHSPFSSIDSYRLLVLSQKLPIRFHVSAHRSISLPGAWLHQHVSPSSIYSFAVIAVYHNYTRMNLAYELICAKYTIHTCIYVSMTCSVLWSCPTHLYVILYIHLHIFVWRWYIVRLSALQSLIHKHSYTYWKSYATINCSQILGLILDRFGRLAETFHTKVR